MKRGPTSTTEGSSDGGAPVVAPPIPEPRDIQSRLEVEAAQQRRRTGPELLMSGLIAGLDVGFSPLGFAFVATHLKPAVGTEAATLLAALAFPIGFTFVILGRSQLFTESTLVPVLGVLSGATTVGTLLRQWGLVIAGNLFGALLVALLIANAGPLTTRYSPVLLDSSRELLAYSFGAALLSGILAGWVMALLTWILAVADSTIARIVIIWISVFLIAAAPLHHSVSGASEIITTVLLGGASPGNWLFRFQIPATLGNAIGGVTLVGALKWLQANIGDDVGLLLQRD